MTSALESVGIASGETLKIRLSQTPNPLKTVETFQKENSILLPSLEPTLPLLDLHDIPRATFHEFVMTSLRSTLLQRISDLSGTLKDSTSTQEQKDQSKTYLLEVLQQSFDLVSIETIRPIVMALIKALGIQTPESYLQKLANKSDLYSQCSMEIKQLIWQHDSKLFHNELEPLVKTVLRLRNDKLGNFDPKTISFNQNFLTKGNVPIPRQKRPGAEIVEKISKMCNSSKNLYISCIEYLRSRFKETKCLHYCSLRAEIIMYLHEMDSNHTKQDVDKAISGRDRKVRRFKSVLKFDEKPHRIAWGADSLLKNVCNNLNSESEFTKIKDLMMKIDRVVQDFDKYLNKQENDATFKTDMYDSCMILSDPFFVNHVLLWTLMKKLHTLVPISVKAVTTGDYKDKEINFNNNFTLTRKLFRSVEKNETNIVQNIITNIIKILHLTVMSFEEKISFYNELNREKFEATIIKQVLPLLQSINTQLLVKNQNIQMKLEFEKSKNSNDINITKPTDNKQNTLIEANSEEFAENMLNLNNFLKDQELPEMPLYNYLQVKDILTKIVKILTSIVQQDVIDPLKTPCSIQRATILILRHYSIYLIKFSHFQEFGQLMDAIFDIHKDTLGITIANVTVSDAFFLQYLSSYLIYTPNRNILSKDTKVLYSVLKMLSYTAPDPLPSGRSAKDYRAAAKSGWYDRLVQAEIVLGLINVLSTNLIKDNALRKRLWKKFAPPNITAVAIPSGITNDTMDRWNKLWERWETACKMVPDIGKLDRSKLIKKINVKLPKKKEKKKKKENVENLVEKTNVEEEKEDETKILKLKISKKGLGNLPDKNVRKHKKIRLDSNEVSSEKNDNSTSSTDKLVDKLIDNVSEKQIKVVEPSSKKSKKPKGRNKRKN